VDPSVTLTAPVSIGSFAIVEAGATIGRGVIIGAHAHIGTGSIIGAGCRLEPYARVIGPRGVLGEGCIIESHASVGPEVFLGQSTTIGHGASLQGSVVLGEKCEVGASTMMRGPIVAGAGNAFFPHCTVGTATRHLGSACYGHIEIGSNCIVEAHCNIFHPTGQKDSNGGIQESITRLGDRVYVMPYSNVGHDVVIEDGAEVASNLAGYVRVMRGAKVANSSSLHQFTTIGTCSFIAMGTACRHDVLPYCVLLNERCTLDRVGLFKSGKSSVEADQLDAFYTEALSGARAAYRRQVEVPSCYWFAEEVTRFFRLRESMRDCRPLAAYSQDAC
jgi:acyl-[acyl carrier protein]--UDP-N-acetylglucosamine O-acyltransferase